MVEYKESNLAWFGCIPKNWNLIPLKYLIAKIYTGGTPTTGVNEFWTDNDEGINWVAISDISKSNGLLQNTAKRITEKGRESKGLEIIPKGTMLLSIFASLGKVTTLDINATVNQAIIGIVPNELLHNKFLKYLFIDCENYISFFSSANTQENLNVTKIKDLIFPVPPKETQIRIADFLDKKTAEIDAIIEKKENLLLLLEEKKKAIINEAITKGLNPNASMIDSGIELIGEIPKHWKVKPLGYLGSCQNGVSKGGDYFGEGYPFVNYGDIYKNYELPAVVEGFAKSSEEDREVYSVLYGDVFFTRTSETIEEIGIASTCLKTIENAVFSGFAIRFRPYSVQELYPEYSKYFFRSNYVRVSFVKEMNLVTRASLSQTLLKSLKVILPPYEEQKNIVLYFQDRFQIIDKAKEKINVQIDKLKEFRKSLISEVVTGKIDI